MITDGTSFPVILKLSGKLGGLVRHRNPLIFGRDVFVLLKFMFQGFP